MNTRLRNLSLQKKKDKYYVNINGGSTFLLVLLLCLSICFFSYAHIQLNVCNSEVWCKGFRNKIITVTRHLVQYNSELEKHPTHMQNTYTLFALTPLKVRY